VFAAEQLKWLVEDEGEEEMLEDSSSFAMEMDGLDVFEVFLKFVEEHLSLWEQLPEELRKEVMALRHRGERS
jgi:hypothetical protein